MTTLETFDSIDMRIGTIVAVDINKRARKPAYKLEIDFGNEIGHKLSSAQITDLYTPESLIGMKVVCCVNLPPMRIGSVKTEVRILGADNEKGCVLLTPSLMANNGDRIF